MFVILSGRVTSKKENNKKVGGGGIGKEER